MARTVTNFAELSRFRLWRRRAALQRSRKRKIWATSYRREILLLVPRICISEFAQMRTKPTAPAAPKRKMPASGKPARRLIASLAKQLAEAQVLRDQAAKSRS